jgi:hypothetical protein
MWQISSITIATLGVILLAACSASPPPAAAPAAATTKILAMTQMGSDFVLLKEKPDGSQVACFYENYDDHRPLGAEGCAPVPPQDTDQAQPPVTLPSG